MVAVDFPDLGLDIDVWPWVWLGLGVVFTLVELAFIGGTFVLLPYAISAFVAAVLAFYDVAVEVQWATFIGGGTLLLLVLLKWVRGFLSQNTLPKGVGADRLVGTIGFVTAPIDPGDASRRGRVTIEGEIWGALSESPSTLPVGTKIQVVAMVGTRVVVAPVARSLPADREPGSSSSDTPNQAPGREEAS